MTPESFRLHIEEMDCPVEKAEIEDLFKQNPDFSPIACNLSKREMVFLKNRPEASIESLLEILSRAGFPATEVKDEGSNTDLFVVYVEDMDCSVEKSQIESSFQQDSDFTAVNFNLESRQVTFQKKTPEATPEKLLEHLTKLGLPGKLVSAQEPITKEVTPPKKFPWKLLFALIFASVSEVIELIEALPETVVIAFAVAAIGLSGIKTLKKGLANLPHLTFNMNTLMAVAVLGAVAIGQYPEAAMVMVLYEIGEEIEERTLLHAHKSIQTLLGKTPPAVEILIGNEWTKSAPESVVSGTVYRAVPGQMLVADGMVIEGESSLDVSSLTGESVPESAHPGVEVRSGSLAIDGTITIRANRAANESTAARISRAIISAQEKKAKLERIVDHFARYYTPTIFAMSLLLAIGTTLYTGTFDRETIYRSLVLLVIGCPCALVISTPVALLSAMTCASRNGVFVRGGVPMETAAALKTVVFDKTGTLTVGKPSFKTLIPLAGTDTATDWRLATALARANKHPLSQALARACNPEMNVPLVSQLKNLPGYGVEGRVDGAMIRLTNRTWLEEKKLLTPEAIEAFKHLESTGNTCLAVSNIFGALAVFAFSDTPKPNISHSIETLKNEKVDVWLLTGDNENSAQNIAKLAGITNVRAKLLPQDKLSLISELDAKAPTAMVGDGINDAPALARARLGIAMGTMGADMAIESADVVLMNDDVAKVAWLKRLSQKTCNCVKQNIAFALAVKVAFAAAAVTGMATMWMAVFADTGVCLIVVAWALRLLKFK